MVEKIFDNKAHQILVPHPVLYETLCTKMVKNSKQVMLLTHYFNMAVKVSDKEYVNEAYQKIEQQATMQRGNASMVDIAIMLMAEDPRNNVKGILTFNGRDFSSFCQRNRIPMIENMTDLNSI